MSNAAEELMSLDEFLVREGEQSALNMPAAW
jgi:hypothetical protein